MIQIPEGESVYQYKHRFFDRNGDADVDVTKQPQLLNQLFERKSQNLFESRCVAGLKVDDLDGDTFVQCRKVKTQEGGGHPYDICQDTGLNVYSVIIHTMIISAGKIMEPGMMTGLL